MYDVRCYKNTGFNSVDVPDSPALLDQYEFIDLKSTDLMQNRALTSISVRANNDQMKNVDYCRIGDLFYIVLSTWQTSVDVAVLSLEFDALTSMGGGANVLPLSGMVSRAHVADDTFGKYTEPEPFTASQPLEIVNGAKIGSKVNGAGNMTTVIISTVDLSDTEKTSTLYEDPAAADSKIAVPQFKKAPGDTQFTMQKPDGGTSTMFMPLCKSYANTDNVKDNIARLRMLGLEGAIVAQYEVPSDVVTVSTAGDVISAITAKSTEESSGLPLIYASANNKKVFTGTANNYMLYSMASGSTAEFMPEDINDGNSAPHFITFADPRPGCTPFARPKSVLGDTTNIFKNAITGERWSDTPLRYEGASGSYWTKQNFNADRVKQGWQNQQDIRELTGIKPSMGFTDYVKNAAGAANRAGGALISAAGMVAGAGVDAAAIALGTQQAGTYAMTDAAESALYGNTINLAREQAYGSRKALLQHAQTMTVAPEIQFPKSPTLRDFVGNGFIVMRYRYSAADLARFDRFLTMYGYKVTKTLERSDFTNRQKFNYVEATGVTLEDNTRPRWIKEAAAAQLSAGVRVWHIKPDASAYNSNPVK